ncbi:MAG: YeeE/YedE thiosulfate transporter family protein [Myxococcota bacterium]|jgi:hypothetical protein|nr:YeeE/YedE thiosulfate transporter family protein [Myxococcota bacterium]
MLILNDQVPMHWALAGALIGAMTLLLLWGVNRRLGLSTGFESVCALVIRSPYFCRDSLQRSAPWRLPLVVGLVLGGALSATLSGGWSPTWSLGTLGSGLGLSETGVAVWMFVGGLFIGFGTRLAGGCTSGHGIFGVSNLEVSGLLTTVSFMGAGVVTTQLVYRLLVGL